MSRRWTNSRWTGWAKFAAVSVALLLALMTTAAVAHTHEDGAADTAHCSLCISAHHAPASVAHAPAVVAAQAPQPLVLPARKAPRVLADHALPYESRPPPVS